LLNAKRDGQDGGEQVFVKRVGMDVQAFYVYAGGEGEEGGLEEAESPRLDGGKASGANINDSMIAACIR